MLLGEPLEVRLERPVLRLRPWLDGALGERLGLVRDDQVHVEVDGIAEPLATRTGAIRVVERKQPRFRLLVSDVAALALEALGVSPALRLSRIGGRGLEHYFAGLAVAGLDGVNQAGTNVGSDR